MSVEPRVLVTRPAGQADTLLGALRDEGFATLHWPLLRIEALEPLPATERQKLLDLDRYDHLVFISGNAARMGLRCIDDYWPQYPLGQRYWAVGETTARVLRAAGLEVDAPEIDMSSEGLLAMAGLARIDGQRVLIFKGEGGRDYLRQQLGQRGARVDTLSCYRRGRETLDPAVCQEQLAREPVQLMMVSSGDGLEHLSGLLRPRENTNLTALSLIAPSARVAEQARELGWVHVAVADNASDAAMLAAAQAWREAYLGETEH